MNFQTLLQSKWLKVVAVIFGILFLMSLSFAAGLKVGFSKAHRSFQWGENYERNFFDRGPQKGMMKGMGNIDGREYRNAHGTIGQILSISENSLIVRDRENQEDIVIVRDQSVITERRTKKTFSDLKAGDFIAVIGKPNEQGEIVAELIRIMRETPSGKRGMFFQSEDR